ncbi:hypothetical protein DPMN_135259 [Dreissena polymorpha]|uniref:Uncharacterized protein n=1 Tax=Dreissena polymorpha TaxID=45954 RepID=A0A9D4JEH7_DREPO|nr:hypothetical protein DPMN_135259 [Dreissena polymorpha]
MGENFGDKLKFVKRDAFARGFRAWAAVSSRGKPEDQNNSQRDQAKLQISLRNKESVSSFTRSSLLTNCLQLSWVPTADQINSIKPDQAVGYWSCAVGMSGRVELGRVWSGNFGDRDDRVDRIGSGNPPPSVDPI